MASVDEAKAALKVAELEAELVAAKDAGDAKRLAAVKPKLREARQSHREFRESGPGAATPAPINARARVKEG